MIKDSDKGVFDVVLVGKLDRFARNRYDSAHYKTILKKNGVKVMSAKETEQIKALLLTKEEIEYGFTVSRKSTLPCKKGDKLS